MRTHALWVVVLSHLACTPGDGPAEDEGDGGCASSAPPTWYADQDGDGLGDPDTSFVGCTPPDGYVAFAGDEAPECATNDVDECAVCGGPGRRAFFADADGDGLGDPYVSEVACEPPEGYVANADDEEPWPIQLHASSAIHARPVRTQAPAMADSNTTAGLASRPCCLHIWRQTFSI